MSKTDLMKFIKLFEDDLTLDNLALSQLRALCRILQVRIMPFATPDTLRFQLNLRLRELRADDKLIVHEGGPSTLTIDRLQEACRERGMRAMGMSGERLQQQLQQWLELSQNEQVPESLLLLSRAFYFPEEVQFSDRLKNILSMVPDNVKKMAEQRISEVEGNKIDYKERRLIIANIEKMIAEEKAAKHALEKKKADEEKVGMDGF